jgi:hypothetical protein
MIIPRAGPIAPQQARIAADKIEPTKIVFSSLFMLPPVVKNEQTPRLPHLGNPVNLLPVPPVQAIRNSRKFR